MKTANGLQLTADSRTQRGGGGSGVNHKDTKTQRGIGQGDRAVAARVDRTCNHLATVREILAELEKAQKKHPGWTRDPIHAVGIIQEELGEAMKEAVDLVHNVRSVAEGMGCAIRLRRELLQTAAVCIRALEAIRPSDQRQALEMMGMERWDRD